MSFDDFRTEILAARPEGSGPKNLVLLDRVDSTNRLAGRMVRDYLDESMRPPPVLLLACEQTGGRGRQGRPWQSPRGSGLYATRVVEAVGEGALGSLPLLVAVGLARAIRGLLGEALGDRCRIKWPNDLLVDGRKIAGVLIEAVSRGTQGALALVGFGANHGCAENEPPVPEATTLSLALRSEGTDAPSFGSFVWALVLAVEEELRHVGEAGYAVGSYRALSLHSEGDRLACAIAGERLEGTFRGFDEHGFLVLETPRGERHIAAGEVVER